MLGGGPISTPSVSITAEPSGTVCTVTVTTTTKADIPWTDVTIGLHNISDATELTAPTKPTGTVSGGDLISITDLVDTKQYRVTSVYTSTGGTMGTATWTQ